MATPPLKLKRGTTSSGAPKNVATAVAGEPIIRYNTDQAKYNNITEFYLGDSGGTTSKLVADSGATAAANEILTAFTVETIDGNADGVDAALTLTSQDITGSAITVKPPSDLAADYTLTLPPNDGNPSDVLQTDGAGVLTWVAQTSGFSGFTIAADTGTAESVASADEITFTGGTGIDTTVGATDTITIAIDTAVTADLSSAQTLTNKTLQDSTTSIVDNGDASKVLQFDAAGITPATTRTLTAPDASGTIALTSSTTGVVVESVAATASAGIAIGGTATAPTVGFTGAGSLTTNDLLKWNGSQLVDSSITDDGTTVTIAADLTVTGTTTTVSTTNTVVSDRILELANGATGVPAATADAGIVIERGDSNNVFFGFDEGIDVFVAGTTAITGAGGDAAPTPIAFLALQYNVTDTAGTNEAVVSYLGAGGLFTGSAAGRYLQNVTIDCGEY